MDRTLQMIGDKSSKARHEHAVQNKGKGGRGKAEEQDSQREANSEG